MDRHKLELIRVNSLLFERSLRKWKGKPPVGSKCLHNTYLMKACIRIQKELLWFNNNETNNLIFKRVGKRFEQMLHQKGVQTTNEPVKRCSEPFVIRKMQRKSQRDITTDLSEALNFWQKLASETLTLFQWECKMVQLPWETGYHCLIKLNINLPYKPIPDIYPR